MRESSLNGECQWHVLIVLNTILLAISTFLASLIGGFLAGIRNAKVDLHLELEAKDRRNKRTS